MAGKTGTSRWLAAGFTALTLGFGAGGISAAHAETSLMNVSYDVTRELYKDINAGFIVVSVDREVAIFALFGKSDLSALSAIPPQVVP